ncbi:MAG: response regulator [Bryobacteraceae bacterium]
MKFNWTGGYNKSDEQYCHSGSARVIIVDDDESQRSGLSSMVSSWGFNVETAADGQDALEKMRGTVSGTRH